MQSTNESFLYMAIMGCRPPGRFTEQHDIFFGIAPQITDLVPAIQEAWPEAKKKIHVDAWRKVTFANGYRIKAVPVNEPITGEAAKLFFINLGGYKPGEFEEFHYKMVVAATDKGKAVQIAKQSAFYQHTGFKGAASHIDDKFGIDVDDLYEIEDILPVAMKAQWKLILTPSDQVVEDEIYLGYMPLHKLHAPS